MGGPIPYAPLPPEWYGFKPHRNRELDPPKPILWLYRLEPLLLLVGMAFWGVVFWLFCAAAIKILERI